MTSTKLSLNCTCATTGLKKSDWAGCDLGRRLMYTASEKLAIIRLVEDSDGSICSDDVHTITKAKLTEL